SGRVVHAVSQLKREQQFSQTQENSQVPRWGGCAAHVQVDNRCFQTTTTTGAFTTTPADCTSSRHHASTFHIAAWRHLQQQPSFRPSCLMYRTTTR
ncbi:unnamed protein product, partial [Sphacelaria rigidula]